jgi:hypothetical protein
LPRSERKEMSKDRAQDTTLEFVEYTVQLLSVTLSALTTLLPIEEPALRTESLRLR